MFYSYGCDIVFRFDVILFILMCDPCHELKKKDMTCNVQSVFVDCYGDVLF